MMIIPIGQHLQNELLKFHNELLPIMKEVFGESEVYRMMYCAYEIHNMLHENWHQLLKYQHLTLIIDKEK